MYSVDTMKARPPSDMSLKATEEGRICEVMGVKDGFSQVKQKWRLASLGPAFQQKQNISNKSLTAH